MRRIQYMFIEGSGVTIDTLFNRPIFYDENVKENIIEFRVYK